jgi:hypothetical protein
MDPGSRCSALSWTGLNPSSDSDGSAIDQDKVNGNLSELWVPMADLKR